MTKSQKELVARYFLKEFCILKVKNSELRFPLYSTCVTAYAWPFPQRINRSPVAEVTGEIRGERRPRLRRHPSSDASAHVWLCTGEDVRCIHCATFLGKRYKTPRRIKKKTGFLKRPRSFSRPTFLAALPRSRLRAVGIIN